MENIFESYPGSEFIKFDNRRLRQTNNISADSQYNKLLVQLPNWLIQGKTILDLGCCLGAAGHWALSNGAKHYTGVEIQNFYHETSKELFGKIWKPEQFTLVQSEIEKFLEDEINSGNHYDIIVAGGILYAFVDPFSLMRKITDVTKEAVVIDTIWLKDFGNGIIMFNENTNINYANDTKSFKGLGSKVSPMALDIIMSSYGFFNKENILMPARVKHGHDSFHDMVKHGATVGPNRYMARYFKSSKKSSSIKEKIVAQDTTSLTDFPTVQIVESNADSAWAFDENVAKRFQQEACQHIPDYERVINLCLEIANRTINKESLIADVGSALGYTLDLFVKNGYSNVYGVESSDAMLNSTLHRERVLKSSKFPLQVFDMVLINWTLHFVIDKVNYLKDVFENLSKGGILVLTDKTIQSPVVKDMYYSFKRNNGVTQEYIEQKEKQLQGVMHSMPASWYIEQLQIIGFTDIEIVNSRLGFVTYMCKRP